ARPESGELVAQAVARLFQQRPPLRVDSDGRPSATQIAEGANQQGSAAQELDVVELACQRHGPPCRVPRPLDLARAVPDVSQGKEQLGLTAGVGLVGELHRL